MVCLGIWFNRTSRVSGLLNMRILAAENKNTNKYYHMILVEPLGLKVVAMFENCQVLHQALAPKVPKSYFDTISLLMGV